MPWGSLVHCSPQGMNSTAPQGTASMPHPRKLAQKRESKTPQCLQLPDPSLHKDSLLNQDSRMPRNRADLGSHEGVLGAGFRIYEKQLRTVGGTHHCCQGPASSQYWIHCSLGFSEELCFVCSQLPFLQARSFATDFREAKWMCSFCLSDTVSWVGYFPPFTLFPLY